MGNYNGQEAAPGNCLVIRSIGSSLHWSLRYLNISEVIKYSYLENTGREDREVACLPFFFFFFLDGEKLLTCFSEKERERRGS